MKSSFFSLLYIGVLVLLAIYILTQVAYSNTFLATGGIISSRVFTSTTSSSSSAPGGFSEISPQAIPPFPIIAAQSAGSVYGWVDVFLCKDSDCSTREIKEFGTPSELGGPPYGTADGFNEIRYGVDKLPFLVHDFYDYANSAYILRMVKCNDSNCSSYQRSFTPVTHPIVNYPFGGSFATEIGFDGNPLIAWIKKAPTGLLNDKIVVVRCLNRSCSQQDVPHEISVVNINDEFGPFGMDVEIGSDGFPILTAVSRKVGTYKDKLFFAKCDDLACASYSSRILDGYSAFGTGYASAIAIDPLGNPVITYTDKLSTIGSAQIKLLTCSQKDCSGATTINLIQLGSPAYHSDIVFRSNNLPILSTTVSMSQGNEIRAIDCLNPYCTNFSTQTIPGTGTYPYPMSAIRLTPAGLPIVASIGDGSAWLAKCLTMDCSQLVSQNLGSIYTISPDQPVHPFGSHVTLDTS